MAAVMGGLTTGAVILLTGINCLTGAWNGAGGGGGGGNGGGGGGGAIWIVLFCGT